MKDMALLHHTNNKISYEDAYMQKHIFNITQLSPQEAGTYSDQIVSIYRDVWLDTYPCQKLGITRKDLESKFTNMQALETNWKKNILNSINRAYWIVTDQEGNTVGFCIAKKGELEHELEYIYLLPVAQGKGTGCALMERALSWMGEGRSIVLYGAAYNHLAIRFYMKFGFTLTKEFVPSKKLPNGKEIPSMKMVLTRSQYDI